MYVCIPFLCFNFAVQCCSERCIHWIHCKILIMYCVQRTILRFTSPCTLPPFCWTHLLIDPHVSSCVHLWCVFVQYKNIKDYRIHISHIRIVNPITCVHGIHLYEQHCIVNALMPCSVDARVLFLSIGYTRFLDSLPI